MPDNKNYSEDSKNFILNEQNKKIKKKLEEEYGMTSIEGDSEASPELINNFLNYVEDFEKSWKNTESKKIKEILNFPDFKKCEEIKPAFLPDEIDKVLDIYSKYNIYIDVIERDDVTDMEFYKFLTEELMEHETTFVNLHGMNTNFIYEEFHPNDKLDAKNSIESFLNYVKNKDREYIGTWLSEDPMYFNGNPLSRNEFLDTVFDLIPNTGRKSQISFRNIDTGKNEVLADLILEIDNSANTQLTLRLLFGIEKSEFGMYNIKTVTLIK